MRTLRRVSRACLIIMLTPVLFVSAAFLWPVYLGIAVLRPKLVERLWEIKVF